MNRILIALAILIAFSFKGADTPSALRMEPAQIQWWWRLVCQSHRCPTWRFCNQYLGTDFDTDYAEVEVGSAELFNYAFVHMTGRGNVVLPTPKR